MHLIEMFTFLLKTTTDVQRLLICTYCLKKEISHALDNPVKANDMQTNTSILLFTLYNKTVREQILEETVITNREQQMNK